MNSVVKSIAPNNDAAAEFGESLTERLKLRESNEIVVAFAGPIGAGIQSIINKTRGSLIELGYSRIKIVKLSQFLSEKLEAGSLNQNSPDPGKSSRFSHYRKLQHAGRELRERTQNMQILAEYAVQQIVVDREHSREKGEAHNSRVAYLIDQLKRPEEVELLRALYRNIFYLIGVTKPYEQRKKLLEEEGVYEEETENLMDIDRNEEGKGGQRLDKTLHLSDFFVRNDSTLDRRDSIKRFLSLIHGDKGRTPDRLETGMYAAYAAGLRSACLSRQVGAAITNGSNEIIATGCNDVPAPLGGLYSANSPFDRRCIHQDGGTCFNDREKRKLQESIGKVVRQKLKNLSLGKPIDEDWVSDLLESFYDQTRLGSLIEFSRSVHAEMDAIVSLARAGGTGLSGATLYTTTFPCHSCARHIVAAGISEVYYIEPYEKSMAEILHKDAISFEEPREATNDDGNSAKEYPRVKFLHFEGVAPRLFATAFRAEGRKEKRSGKFIPISKDNPTKILPEYLDNYHEFEDAAIKHFNNIMGNLNSHQP